MLASLLYLHCPKVLEGYTVTDLPALAVNFLAY